MKKLLILLIITLFSTACGTQSTNLAEVPYYLREENTQIPETAENTANTPFAEYPTHELPTLSVFAPIITAYMDLQASDFTEIDEEILGDSLFFEYAMAGMSPWCFGENPTISHAFLDINGDGFSELFIGISGGITGIYTWANGEIISVVQVPSWREQLSIFTDIDGNHVILEYVARMSIAGEFFRRLDENGTIIELDRFFTQEIWRFNEDLDDYEVELLRYRYICYNPATLANERERLSEEEYRDLIRQYGSWGHFVNFDEEIRSVVLEWRDLAEFLE